MPLKAFPIPGRPATQTTLRVLQRFEFEPGLMRSGVIACEQGAASGTALLFVKGAPSMLKPLLKAETLPPDFQQVLDMMMFALPCMHTAAHSCVLCTHAVLRDL